MPVPPNQLPFGTYGGGGGSEGAGNQLAHPVESYPSAAAYQADSPQQQRPPTMILQDATGQVMPYASGPQRSASMPLIPTQSTSGSYSVMQTQQVAPPGEQYNYPWGEQT